MARPAKLTPAQLETVLAEYATLKHGSKTAWKEATAERLGCKRQTLEYYLYGYRPMSHQLSVPHAVLSQPCEAA